MALVLFDTYARFVCMGLAIVDFGRSGWMTVFHDNGASDVLIGFAILAGVLADFIARRADETVSAAAAVAPQGQNLESTDARKK